MEENYDIEAIEAELRDLARSLPDAGLAALRGALERSARKLREPMQLAIIGKISSSKSTLVNAILGKEEVMATGQMEVTYNVGWLKYGSPESEIVIHHKDGSPDTRRRPEEFLRWSVEAEGREEMRSNVSYIETHDDAEILRELNIIDTPGLDAVRGQDSQNTLEFLRQVRPDAVIMLFTNSVAENTLEVVRDFNRGGSFNPLNAIGVLSKIDVLWMEDAEHARTALEIGKRMAAGTLTKYPMLRKTLFGIYPVSALLFLRASTLTAEDFALLGRLARGARELWPCLMMSAEDFADPAYETPLTAEERRGLLERVGLYGADLVARYVWECPKATLEGARERLYAESGAREFMKVLHNHFGGRARLIKMESIYQDLQRAVNEERAGGGEGARQTLDRVEQRVADVFSALVHEHAEYELLNKIYCHEVELDEEVAEEFLSLCGERGASAPERLRMGEGKRSAREMMEEARRREAYWRRELNDEFDPDEKEWMRVMLSAYSRLRRKLQEASYQYERSRAFLFNE